MAWRRPQRDGRPNGLELHDELETWRLVWEELTDVSKGPLPVWIRSPDRILDFNKRRGPPLRLGRAERHRRPERASRPPRVDQEL